MVAYGFGVGQFLPGLSVNYSPAVTNGFEVWFRGRFLLTDWGMEQGHELFVAQVNWPTNPCFFGPFQYFRHGAFATIAGLADFSQR